MMLQMFDAVRSKSVTLFLQLASNALNELAPIELSKGVSRYFALIGHK